MKAMLYIIALIIAIGVAGAILQAVGNDNASAEITNFQECVDAGYPVMESYPRQCATPGGEVFVEEIAEQVPGTSQPFVGAGCALAGCSQVVCANEDEAADIVTDCMMRPEYACYQSDNARCEQQNDGQCAWTETPELQACLANPPML